MITRKLVGMVAILIAGGVSTQAAEKQEFEAAKQEYEQSSGDETARVTYVTKLAQITDRLLRDYPRSDERNDDSKRAINSEVRFVGQVRRRFSRIADHHGGDPRWDLASIARS